MSRAYDRNKCNCFVCEGKAEVIAREVFLLTFVGAIAGHKNKAHFLTHEYEKCSSFHLVVKYDLTTGDFLPLGRKSITLEIGGSVQSRAIEYEINHSKNKSGVSAFCVWLLRTPLMYQLCLKYSLFTCRCKGFFV